MSTKSIQFVQVTPEQLQEAIIDGVKIQLNDLKQHFKPKEPTEYLTRAEVSEMLKIDVSSVYNWTKRGILIPYQISGRIYFKRADIENAIVKLKN
ncbi:helix-turn-helix domain-containing protein [Winogradskyella sp. MH6]|uniref:helix-turn-helix domain-containing protein n=1 Tax=Winogradskyella sp. MH6 TaxID=2929510 RepID=UPI001FB391CD|nr:helix-turn-helix domain-containing protein [Winogradskyella sp. MH6]